MIDHIIVCALATFAITYMVRYTDGPFDVFLKFRALTGLAAPVIDEDTGECVDYLEYIDPTGFVAKLVGCFWCLSTWVAAIIVLGYILLAGVDISMYVFLWFASIGLSGFLYGLTDG